MKSNEVKFAAQGVWDSILWALTPRLRDALERPGHHVPCPVHGGKDGFRVFRDVAETGGCVCNTCGIRSDGFATLMWIAGISFREALLSVADYLRVNEPKPYLARSAYAKKTDNSQEDRDERARQSLNRVWKESIQVHERDAEPARLYFARRGLSIRPPSTIRFHPSLPYYDGNEMVGEYPAIISMVTGADGNPVTIHRIYITQDGYKAPVRAPKKLMTYPRNRKIVGGAIRLTTEMSPTLLVAEGVETALAVIEGTKEAGLSVWSTVNAGMMESLVPPEWVTRVIVFADKDLPTKQHPKGHGQESAMALVQRLWKRGLKATSTVPAGEIPHGCKSVDWLDVLKAQGVAGFPSIQVAKEAALNTA